jgi:hypothetical protein
MKYTAHTKETIPVLREKSQMREPKPEYKYNCSTYLSELYLYNKHITSLKQIQILPDHVSAFIDGKEYDESEFEVKEVIEDFYCAGNSETEIIHKYAILKQKEESRSAVWVVKSHTSSIADTGDYYTQYYLENESACKNLFLSSDDEEDYQAMADYLNLNSTPQKKLSDWYAEQFKMANRERNELKAKKLSDEEIDALAEKEYPYANKEFQDFEISNKSIQHFIHTIKEVSRKAFIKGLKYRI